MADMLKLIPSEEPDKTRISASEKQPRQKKKNAREKNSANSSANTATQPKPSDNKQSTGKQSPHLQKQYAIEHNVENKKIKTVGYKLVNYASNIARLTQQELVDLIHDAQRSVLFLQKHHRKMIKKKKKN